jgi:hypothetical protein
MIGPLGREQMFRSYRGKVRGGDVVIHVPLLCLRYRNNAKKMRYVLDRWCVSKYSQEHTSDLGE